MWIKYWYNRDDYISSNRLGKEFTAGGVAKAFVVQVLPPKTTVAIITVGSDNIAAAIRWKLKVNWCP